MSIVKGVVIFAGGAVCGGMASYVYFKKQYDEKKSEIDELKAHYTRKLEDEADKKVVDEIIKEQGYISYNTLTDHELKKHIVEVEEKAIKEDKPMDDYPDEPIIIDETDFSETELYFDKIDLDYYLDDGALVDEGDELVIVEDTIGYNILEKFIADDNNDILYVRNPKNNADYQVHKYSGKFSDIIGIGGDEED